ncbi:MAG TPA: M28 family peptidase, partial [Gemmatimonadales bacterium]|nr:M28 family peptidase [Gemmatimonadales bacterium]
MIRSFGITCLVAVGALPLAEAQSGAIQRAAGSITAADIRRRIFVIAHDSMGGRATPSPGLSKTANYIAGEFQRFGLKPGGDAGTYLLKYPIYQKRVLAEQSTVRFGNAGGQRAATTLGTGAALLFGPTGKLARGEVVLVGGALLPDSIKPADVKDRIVVYVPSPSDERLNPVSIGALRRLNETGAAGVVMVVGADSVFAEYAKRQALSRTLVGDAASSGMPVLALLERAITRQVPEAAEQFAQLRAAAASVVQVMQDWNSEIALRDSTLTVNYAPDVVGILEGSDPVLKHEYVVFSAHMDHIGTSGQPGAQCSPVGTDHICNGADDDASGTVGVIELAEAFSQPGARPRRSLIFLTVSGEEQNLWGSEWFVRHPPVPLPQIVADLNADMIGRNWKDTVVAIGKEHSDLGSTLDWVNAAHPELHMVAIDDRWPEESFYTRSDHYNFARSGVPILFFFNGVHADYHRPSDSPDK